MPIETSFSPERMIRNAFEGTAERATDAIPTVDFGVAPAERDPLQEYYEWQSTFDTVYGKWRDSYAETTEDIETLSGFKSFAKDQKVSPEQTRALAGHVPQGASVNMISAFHSPLFVTALTMIGGELLSVNQESETQKETWKYLEDNRRTDAVQWLVKWGLERNEQKQQREQLRALINR